jgi:hypothetical protein
MTPGEGRSSGASEGKHKRVGCKYRQKLFVRHGVAKPVNGVSTCSFCLSFGRERTPPASAEDGIERKRRPKASLNPWSINDFSHARNEDDYEHSQPKMWGKFKASVAAADVISCVPCKVNDARF